MTYTTQEGVGRGGIEERFVLARERIASLAAGEENGLRDALSDY